MSPDKKKRLNILRKKLDSLDNKLIKLIEKEQISLTMFLNSKLINMRL